VFGQNVQHFRAVGAHLYLHFGFERQGDEHGSQVEYSGGKIGEVEVINVHRVAIEGAGVAVNSVVDRVRGFVVFVPQDGTRG
jgi:hypothetical protein